MTGDTRGTCDGLPLRALYTVGELAGAAGVRPYLMRKLLRVKGVELLLPGRIAYVPLSEVQEKLPQLWKSILLSEATRSGI